MLGSELTFGGAMDAFGKQKSNSGVTLKPPPPLFLYSKAKLPLVADIRSSSYTFNITSYEIS